MGFGLNEIKEVGGGIFFYYVHCFFFFFFFLHAKYEWDCRIICVIFEETPSRFSQRLYHFVCPLASRYLLVLANI